MPVEAKPIFRPDLLQPILASFHLPAPFADVVKPLRRWADMLTSSRADKLNEKELLPDFLTDVFCGVLGYRRIVDSPERFTFSREKHVKVDGKFADAVLGEFAMNQPERFVVAVEGKGPKDPLDRPHGSRKMSAVDQGYRYAINLPCDWIIVTSMRQTRLYHKGSNQHTYECFDIADLAGDEATLKCFVFLLGAERVVPSSGKCHFEELLARSEHIGRELTKEFYQRYAEIRDQAFDRLRADNPGVLPAEVLRCTQKLLDRVLFCCFAEDRALLPERTVENAYTHNDPYNPRPIYENFRGLFRAVNYGNAALRVPAYNGGLFADDHLLDGLKVADDVCAHFRSLAAYDFRPTSQLGSKQGQGTFVDVEILGHIFEQSISDLEKLHDELEGRADASTMQDRVSRRKKEGAFYTQNFITRHIVGEALGGVLRDRFEALRLRHAEQSEGTAGRALSDPMAYDISALNRPQKAALVHFWEDWQTELGKIRVLDPACGSGAFLLEAFGQLYAAYQLASDRLDLLRGGRSLFDLDRHILQHNLYGVDLNHEAVDICRLSLWIKTAEHGKPLTSLDGSITAGNSVVADPAVDPRAFDWRARFPQAFADGGFDVVVANPPYVRQEWISAIKPYLKDRYRSFDATADLYVYFYELALDLLRPGGRMSFIVTNKWMRSGYGAALRKLLAEASWVESVVDFGHAKQIFPDADVFPCVMTARKPDASPAPETLRVCAIPRALLRIEDLSRQIQDAGVEVPRSRLGAAPWSLEPPAVDDLLEKLRRAGVPLKDFAGSRPLFGIKTGLNEAFLMDQAARDRLVAEDPKSAELLRPYVRGQDVERWRTRSAGLWMLVIKSSDNHPWPWAASGNGAEKVFSETYPAVYGRLNAHRDALQKRQDKGKYWWELRSCAYWAKFEQPKIFYQDIAWTPAVSYDAKGMLANNTVYFLPSGDLWTLAVLNSPVGWWFAWRKAMHGKDEALRFLTDFVEAFPVPRPTDAQREEAERCVRELLDLAEKQQSGVAAVLDWLAVEFGVTKPNQKLANVTALDEDNLIAEVKKARGRSKPLGVAELQRLRTEHGRSIRPLQERLPEILRLERFVSDLVNAAFGLTDEELTLMWSTAPPRMPIPAP